MRKVSLAEIGRRGSFVASGLLASANDDRCARDPVADSYRAGFAEGEAAARAAAEAQMRAAGAQRDTIALAFARFDADSATLLQDRLHEAVVAICQSMADEVALDPVGLARRVETAAAMIRRKHDQRVIFLNPADLHLVKGHLSPDLHLEADPALAQGQLRVESEDGGVEDGPEQWRAALAQALGACML